MRRIGTAAKQTPQPERPRHQPTAPTRRQRPALRTPSRPIARAPSHSSSSSHPQSHPAPNQDSDSTEGTGGRDDTGVSDQAHTSRDNTPISSRTRGVRSRDTTPKPGALKAHEFHEPEPYGITRDLEDVVRDREWWGIIRPRLDLTISHQKKRNLSKLWHKRQYIYTEIDKFENDDAFLNHYRYDDGSYVPLGKLTDWLHSGRANALATYEINHEDGLEDWERYERLRGHPTDVGGPFH